MRAEREPGRSLFLVVPGTLATPTGGYLYDSRILAELAKLGWSTHVVSLDPAFPVPTTAALDAAAARLAAIPDRSLVVIDGLALAGLRKLLPALVRRLDVIALIHHPLADETGIEAALAAELRAAESEALAAVGGIVVTSPWTRRRLADYGVDPSRVAVVEPGTDRAPRADRPTAETVRLLTVATVTPRKGHADLVAALAALDELDWTLRCVGSLERDRACVTALESQIARSGLGSRIELVGELAAKAIDEEYASADLFVLPSRLEGYGMAIAEAVAHGLPVVSTTAGAIPETLPRGSGCLVAPGDVDALGAVLRRLIADPAALAGLAQAAVAAGRSLPSWESVGSKFARAIRRFGMS